ncbi:Protein of unknown function [Cotesia congregata]|uniref:HAT C-terminal dimerisation domain-containing protein n=1 Tax=Cotesia congregata TaxID=51543 RepID=A0A8J2H909_COTCN|nr:Protein of unknown function [Cotesia congregata]
MNKLPRLLNSCEPQIIDNEWRRFHNFELPDDIKLDDPADIFWHKIFIYGDTEEVWSFKNLAKFFLNIISLPYGSADCERIFSKIGLIKCQVRKKLVTNTLNGLLLSSQRVNHNCIGYEPSKDEYSKMRTSLYTLTTSGNNDNSNNNNNMSVIVDDTLNVDLDDII